MVKDYTPRGGARSPGQASPQESLPCAEGNLNTIHTENVTLVAHLMCSVVFPSVRFLTHGPFSSVTGTDIRRSMLNSLGRSHWSQCPQPLPRALRAEPCFRKPDNGADIPLPRLV